MGRNYGIGSRDMAVAARMIFQRSAQQRECSFATAKLQPQRFEYFVAWAKEQGIRRMEHITPQHVIQYGQALAELVGVGKLSAATAQNRVSAVNSVLTLATRGEWQPVSPTQDCQIAKRNFVRSVAPSGLDEAAVSRAKERIEQHLGAKLVSVVELCRDFGLRSEEAAKINANQALKQALSKGEITITYGTKGGRARTLKLAMPARQIETLERAAKAQQGEKSLIPQAMTWKAYREGPLRDARELLQQETGKGLHDLRASYACERYQVLTGHAPPCSGVRIVDKEQDKAARERIAHELGHGRIDVLTSYVGGRK